MLILARFLNQNASLYTDMQIHNDYYKESILPEIKDYVDFLEDIINS
jgi:prephenate dehydrogenase